MFCLYEDNIMYKMKNIIIFMRSQCKIEIEFQNVARGLQTNHMAYLEYWARSPAKEKIGYLLGLTCKRF